MTFTELRAVDENGTMSPWWEITRWPGSGTVEVSLVLEFNGSSQIRISTTEERARMVMMMSNFPIMRLDPFTGKREGATIKREEAFALLRRS